MSDETLLYELVAGQIQRDYESLSVFNSKFLESRQAYDCHMVKAFIDSFDQIIGALLLDHEHDPDSL